MISGLFSELISCPPTFLAATWESNPSRSPPCSLMENPSNSCLIPFDGIFFTCGGQGNVLSVTSHIPSALA